MPHAFSHIRGHPADTGGMAADPSAGLRLHPDGLLARLGGRGNTASRLIPPRRTPRTAGPSRLSTPMCSMNASSAAATANPAVSLYYPVLHQTAVDEAIRRWATDVADAYEKEISKADGPDEEKPSSYGMWDLTGLFELTRPSEGVVSVTFRVYSYTGGAHGNLEITCLNYDLRTGRRLDLADLFKDPEKALQLMSAWSQKELARSLGEDTDEDMIRDGVAPDLRNFANLTLTPQGLRIEFQPYQVAPWAAGPQRVDMASWRNCRRRPRSPDLAPGPCCRVK